MEKGRKTSKNKGQKSKKQKSNEEFTEELGSDFDEEFKNVMTEIEEELKVKKLKTQKFYTFCSESLDIPRKFRKFDIQTINEFMEKELTSKNILSLEDLQIFMINRKKRNVKDESILSQLKEQLFEEHKTGKFFEICRNNINEDEVKVGFNYDFLFFLSMKKAIVGCDLVAFRFCRKSKIFANSLESRVICAVEIPRSIEQENENGVTSVSILKSGFGPLLTFKTIQWAKGSLYKNLFIRAANLQLVKVYRRWGFHFGTPDLVLDSYIDQFSKESLKISENFDIKFFKDLYNWLTRAAQYWTYDEISKIFRLEQGDNYKFQTDEKFRTGFCETYIKNYIFNEKASTWGMFFDIDNQNDYEKLKELAKSRFEEYYYSDPVFPYY